MQNEGQPCPEAETFTDIYGLGFRIICLCRGYTGFILGIMEKNMEKRQLLFRV